MEELFVGVYLTETSTAPTAVGKLTLDGSKAFFEYNSRYREAILEGRAWALDPTPRNPATPWELPSSDHPGVFSDGAPDAWGQTVLRRIFGRSELTAADRFALSGDDRIGALVFRRRSPPDVSSLVPNLDTLSRYEVLISSVLDGAAAMPEEIRALALAGSSAGGARPKCTFRDSGGRFWLAKFAKPTDPVSIPTLEYATMALAGECGIHIPDLRLATTDTGSAVLLVARFDRTIAGGRKGFVSMQSILARTDMTNGRYGEMANALRMYSTDPKEDAHEVFRRMVLNVIVGNTDDHLKNHGMIREQGGWRLSPAYDITPQVMPDAGHSLSLGSQGNAPMLGNVLSRIDEFMLSQQAAYQIIQEVRDRAESWKEWLAAQGVSAGDIDYIRTSECFAPYRLNS